MSENDNSGRRRDKFRTERKRKSFDGNRAGDRDGRAHPPMGHPHGPIDTGRQFDGGHRSDRQDFKRGRFDGPPMGGARGRGGPSHPIDNRGPRGGRGPRFPNGGRFQGPPGGGRGGGPRMGPGIGASGRGRGPPGLGGPPLLHRGPPLGGGPGVPGPMRTGSAGGAGGLPPPHVAMGALNGRGGGRGGRGFVGHGARGGRNFRGRGAGFGMRGRGGGRQHRPSQFRDQFLFKHVVMPYDVWLQRQEQAAASTNTAEDTKKSDGDTPDGKPDEPSDGAASDAAGENASKNSADGTDDDAMVQKYEQYVQETTREQMDAIFNTYKGQLWFMEQYHPTTVKACIERRREYATRRLDVFMSLLNDNKLDGLEFKDCLLEEPAGKRLKALVREINVRLDATDRPAAPASTAESAKEAVGKSSEETVPDAAVDSGANITETTSSASTAAKETGTTKDGAADGASGDKAADDVARPATPDLDDEAALLDYGEEPPAEGTSTDVTSTAGADKDAEGKEAVAAHTAPPTVSGKNRPLKSFSVELFLRAPVPYPQMETMLKSIAGFRKLAVVYPSELSPLGLLPGARKLFATFCDVRVGKTLHLLRLLLVNGEPINFALVPRNMQSIRIARGTCLDQTDPAADVDRAERVIRVLDAHAGLFQKEGDAHPVLDNAVPDELDECEPAPRRTLTNLVLYLRVTHSMDFFSGFQIAHEDAMAQRLVYLTIPDLHWDKQRRGLKRRKAIKSAGALVAEGAHDQASADPSGATAGGSAATESSAGDASATDAPKDAADTSTDDTTASATTTAITAAKEEDKLVDGEEEGEVVEAGDVPPVVVSPATREWRERLEAIADVASEFEAFADGAIFRDEQQALEAFVSKNTVPVAGSTSGLVMCPLSGKKFRGPEFVRKHILNKHASAIEAFQKECLYFNNFAQDFFRIRKPPRTGILPQPNRGPAPVMVPPHVPTPHQQPVPPQFLSANLPPPGMLAEKDQFGRDIPVQQRTMMPMFHNMSPRIAPVAGGGRGGGLPVPHPHKRSRPFYDL